MADYIGFAGYVFLFLLHERRTQYLRYHALFKSHLNESTPFSTSQYQTQWKLPRYAPWGLTTYPDFDIGNTWNASCRLPTLWQDDGTEVDQSTFSFSGCYSSEFDQFGDMEAFGVHPDWQRQLSKFASVQDRLREWDTDVMQKIKKYSCLTIKALDIDGIRVDKSTQITVDALASWTTSTKACAAAVGKNNFFVVGEVTGGDTFGSLYMYAFCLALLCQALNIQFQWPWPHPHPETSWLSSSC